MVAYWKLKVAHYVIMSGDVIKLSESCIAMSTSDAKDELYEIFETRVNRAVAELKEDKNNVDVTQLDVTSMNTTITFDGLNGMHILEYYITLE